MNQNLAPFKEVVRNWILKNNMEEVMEYEPEEDLIVNVKGF